MAVEINLDENEQPTKPEPKAAPLPSPVSQESHLEYSLVQAKIERDHWFTELRTLTKLTQQAREELQQSAGYQRLQQCENAVRETTALATKADKAVNRLQEDLAKLKEAESAE